jgi:hypothetical protein
MVWVRHPDAGGVSILEHVKQRTKTRILRHAEEHFAGKYTRIDVRFRAQFCYVDAFTEPAVSEGPPPGWRESPEEYVERLKKTPLHLFRLRYFGDENAWAFSIYAYSSEKYELSMLPSGNFYGTPEEAFDVAAQAYLSEAW